LLCRAAGVDEGSLPASMTAHSTAYMGDLYRLAELDIAERERLKNDMER